MSQGLAEIVIAGSGPAGYTAAIYAARAGHKTTLIEGLSGGQLMITTDVENFPGFPESIGGPDLMSRMREQAQRFSVDLVSDFVQSVDLSKRPFTVKLSSDSIQTQTFIVATGATAKWLGLPSEEKYKGRGVSACATCDGFFFREKRVAVIGGGDTAAEEACYLTNHASEVFLIHRRDELRASDIMAKRVLANPKIKPKWFRVVDEVLGDAKGVTGLRIKDPRSETKEEISVEGIFVAIGHRPNTEFLEGQLTLEDSGYIVTEPGTTTTSIPGVFAAGDVQDSVFRQAVTAAGTGCMAAIQAAQFLEDNPISG